MISDFFKSLFDKITSIVQWVADVFVAIFVALWQFFQDAVCWVFEQVLSLVVSIIKDIDISSMPNSSVLGSISGDILNILALIGVGKAIAIITAAIAIRMALQLIPFVRLGS